MPPDSAQRFPDGAHFRIEIPSVEGPAVFASVLREAEVRGVVVNRVSQGSGAMLLEEAELREMAKIGADLGVEVSLFVGPREEWGLYSGGAGAGTGGIRGLRQLRYAVEDVLRAVECGIRGFLIADLGLLNVLRTGQQVGQIPDDVVWKISVVLAPANPATMAVLDRAGAGTVNVPGNLTLAELADMRAVTDLPIDLYIESPDNMGGVVRGEQFADIAAVCAPLYAKFGLRNSRGLYPSGLHTRAAAEEIGREKVRRAQLALEWASRDGRELIQSDWGAPGLAVPQP
ncbi:MAG: hypothetical protein JWM79_3357 [Nocardioides sp.]|nr:hypothetical protein [Nocardioides sp.]